MSAQGTVEDLCETSALLEEAAERYLADSALSDHSVSVVWKSLAELGWFDLCRAHADGGLGLPPGALGGLFRVAGRHLLPGPLVETMLVAPQLSRIAGEAGYDSLPRAVAEGRAFLALVDPVGGLVECNQLECGDDSRVSGAIRAVPHAGRADVLAVVVEDAQVVLVERDQPGVSVTACEPLTETHEVADVSFDRAECVRLSRSPDVVAELRAWCRLLTASWLSGVAEQTVTMTVDYVKERQQFGRVVGSFQAVQHEVADMVADSSTISNLVSLSLAQVPSGSSMTDCDVAMAAKAHSAETCLRVCESALQMHGGIGFTADYPLRQYYGSALALRGYYGDPQSLFTELGRRMLR